MKYIQRRGAGNFLPVSICYQGIQILRNLVGIKLGGVGPVDNRPSTDKLHHFKKKNVTCDT